MRPHPPPPPTPPPPRCSPGRFVRACRRRLAAIVGATRAIGEPIAGSGDLFRCETAIAESSARPGDGRFGVGI